MKLLKLHVERGMTTQIGEKEWRKITYGLESDVAGLSLDELEKTRLDLAFKIDDWLQQEQGGIPAEATRDPRGPSSGIPQIDIAELDECPWQTYQKKPAGPGKVAWIKTPSHFQRFDAPKVLWELEKALDGAQDHKLVLGDVEYVFGGKEGQFINRKPAKMESAR